ncbi:MAG: serine/threonine protein kinase [Deltaproteobacteria bacterium]|nr:serine/threonine protein kinase [Deltaproteobacteria bacterium]
MMGDPAHRDGRMLGRYVIYDEFASGGMASVHFGRLSGPVGFSRPVAIKRLHPHLARDPEFVGMFLDEARLAARVRHPNVVPTLDVVSLEDEVFIVMEYVLGESLARLARAQQKQGSPVPLRFAVAAVASALHGLHAAHTATDEQGQPLGLVHRDVSPQNILVGSDGVARMLDFGVAKAAGRISDTRDGALKGKVAYMPPEQLMSRDVSAQSDVYAASVVLWELLTGKRMFEGSTDAAVVAKILAQMVEHDVPKPSKLVPSVPPALDDIVMRGLAPKVEDRFATAREMALLLEKNGGLVAASEMGEWVESLAGSSLGKRSARIRVIEASGSTPDLAADAGRPSAPSTTGRTSMPVPTSTGVRERDVETLVGDVVSGAGSSASAEPPGRRTKRTLAVVAVVAFLLGLAVVGGLAQRDALRRSGDGEAKPSAGSQPGPATGSAIAATSSTAALSAPQGAASTEPSATPAAAIASASSSPSAAASAPVILGVKGVSTKGVHNHPPPMAAPKPKPDDCDPPYTFDADGHKVYKRNCLK